MTRYENILYFNFSGVLVQIRSNSEDLVKRLSKDFSIYTDKASKTKKMRFFFDAILEDEISEIIPSWPEIRRSKNSISYERGRIRYNDYYGQLTSRYDYKNDSAKLYATKIEKLHEITYLLILSRVGKYFDLHGVHKIHAFGIVYKDICAVGMMDMGVGKSSLLLELLRDKNVSLLSDDTPLVTQDGIVKKFPLRIGIEEVPQGMDIVNSKRNIYSIKREHYGEKQLICLDGIGNDINDQYEKLLIFEGRRKKGGPSRLYTASKLSMLWALQKHMVIGIGLPLIFEYFWESGPIDFYKKAKIFILRQKAALALTRKCNYFIFDMSENLAENAEVLKMKMKELGETSS